MTDYDNEMRAIVANRKHPYAMCEHCGMNGIRFKMVSTSIPNIEPSDIELIVVGEAPGIDEVIAKAPFVGASGQLMRGTLRSNGVDPANVAYTNAVLCRPPDNDLKPYEKAIEYCRPRLEYELQRIGTDETPILAAGKHAATTVLRVTQGVRAPKSVRITTARGAWWHRLDGKGGALVNKDVLLTIHPAYVLRNPSVMPDFEHDVRLLKHPVPAHTLQNQPSFVIPRTIEQLKGMLDEIQDGQWVSFDVETSGLIWYDRVSSPGARLLMLGIGTSNSESIIIDEDLIFGGGLRLQALLNGFFQRVKISAHNGKFDCLFAHRYGFGSARIDFDTMLAHYALREVPPHGLKEVAMMKYHIPNYEEALILKYFSSMKKEDRDYSLVPKMELAKYLAWDLAVTFQLREDFNAEMVAEGLFEWPFSQVLMPASEAFIQVEKAGMLVDVPYIEAVDRDVLAKDEQNALVALRDMTGMHKFNPRSWQQVGKQLFDVYGFEPVKSKHFPVRSTCAAALTQIGPELLQHPFTRALFLYRRISKIRSSYVKTILRLVDVTGRVHPSYRIIGAETGRLSATDPAIQTLPRAAKDHYGPIIRQSFIAAHGWKLVMADFAQMEMKVWAHFCQDPFLLEVYRNGRDLHSEGASRLFGINFTKEQRTWVKNFNFAYVYGGNEYSFAGQYNLPIEQARAFVQEYETMMPVARQWRVNVFAEAMKLGYVQTMFGRKRRFPLINKETEDEIRKVSWNFPVQSVASDITLLSLIQLVAEGFNVVVNVHDSIGVHCLASEADATARRMREIMVGTADRYITSVPNGVDIDIQDRWSELPEDNVADQDVSELFDTGDNEVLEIVT